MLLSLSALRRPNHPQQASPRQKMSHGLCGSWAHQSATGPQWQGVSQMPLCLERLRTRPNMLVCMASSCKKTIEGTCDFRYVDSRQLKTASVEFRRLPATQEST
eukprot:1125750-Alexandrium_andersonii.AAC.1